VVPTAVHGLLLAAGAGRRGGGPKALRRHPDGSSWLASSARALLDGGCTEVLVVLGAGADEARHLLPDDATAVLCRTWTEGMGASLRTGLDALGRAGDVDAALTHLVDLPDVGAGVVRRVLAEPATPATLRRAAYDGVPGHPVLIGAGHWAAIAASAVGDRGARGYLTGQEVELVECGDLATGLDVDGPTNDQRGAD